MYGISARLAGVLAAALGIAIASPGAAEIGPWIEGGQARVRLIAEGVDAGHLTAAIEIDLPPGWKTYWRNPGDAGIAPLIDFSNSTNIAEPQVAFPVPHRFDDGYGISNVYEGHVVLPVTAVVADPSQPVELRLSLDIGVCEEICIPEHFELDLAVDGSATDPRAGKIIAEAQRTLPLPAQPGVFDVQRIVRSGGTDKRPQFDVSVRAPDAAQAEVFVEGPPDWYAGTAELVGAEGGSAVFRVRFSRVSAKSPLAGAAFRVTIVAADQAIEQDVPLDETR